MMTGAIAAPFVAELAAGVGNSALASTPATGRMPPPALDVPPQASGSQIPMIDFHTHVQAALTPEIVLPIMDRLNIARMVLMPLYYGDKGAAVQDGLGSDEEAADFARAHPGRFIPFVGMQRSELHDGKRWYRPDAISEKIVAHADEMLRTGAFFGMGEFMCNFYPYTHPGLGLSSPYELRCPPSSALMDEFAKLGAHYKVPLVIHCENEPDFSKQMRNLCAAHPDTPIVWAHNCGRSSAADIADMFERYPNLSADLSGMMYTGGGGYGSHWPKATPWQHLIAQPDRTLLPEMRDLFERYSERFTIGVDLAHAREYQFYEQFAAHWRVFFPQLTLATQRKIAFENAERIFRATPAAWLLDGYAPRFAGSSAHAAT